MKNLVAYLKKNGISFEVKDSCKENVKLVYVNVDEINKKPNVVGYIKKKFMWDHRCNYETICIFVEVV